LFVSSLSNAVYKLTNRVLPPTVAGCNSYLSWSRHWHAVV